jgi:hypothetical protein
LLLGLGSGKVYPVFRNPECVKKIFTFFWLVWNNAASSGHPGTGYSSPKPEAVALKSRTIAPPIFADNL